jgi:ABC-type antimicrobial peptide transport system permease subunit
MLIKLALKNIKLKAFRTFLASLSITIASISLILFLGLSAGIQQASFEELEKKNPLTQITVRPNIEDAGLLSFISRSEEGDLTPETLQKILLIDGVKTVHPEIQFNNFASLEANLLGFSFITDSMLFGVPKEFIEQDLQNPELWDQDREPYPCLIPRKLLDLYNMAIAYPQGLPTISEESLLGKELSLYPNYSSFFPGMNEKLDKIKLEIVGFSDKINLLGATLPYEIIENLNSSYASTKKVKYLELFVETERASFTTEVATKIEALGFNTQYFQKNIKEVEAKFTYLSISLGTISLIILLTAAIAIISTFLATIAERTRELGLLGASKSHIKKLILIEAFIIGVLGSVAGTIIGILLSGVVDQIGLKQLEKAAYTPETLFDISPGLIFFTIIFCTFLTILTAYLPAQKASNINPITALKI